MLKMVARRLKIIVERKVSFTVVEIQQSTISSVQYNRACGLNFRNVWTKGKGR